MKFRYNLAKKTFKGKKIVERGVEDLIDEDQRGNHSSASVSNPLSLDKETITPREETQEPKEVSRRDLFSFARLGDFAEAVEEEQKSIKSKKKKSPTEEDLEPATAEEQAEVEPAESVEEEAEQEEVEEVPKQGFFRRLVLKFKSDATPLEYSDRVENTDQQEETFAEALETAEQKQPDESLNIFGLEDDDEEEPEYDRRNLIRQGFHFFAKPAVENVQSKIDSVNKAVDKITKRVPVLRPPGAISEKAFLQACTRCEECIHACPKDAIQRVPKKMGFLIFNTPYIDPMRNPCVMCTDLPCISACPDGALLPVQELSDVSMGYAILDKKKCQAYGDTFCQQCVIDCPVPGAIHQVNDKPIIDKNICTGCGVCMRSCSTVNIPLAIKIKPQMVIDYQLHKKHLEKETARIEAERLAAEQQEEADRLAAEQQETAEVADGEGEQNSQNVES